MKQLSPTVKWFELKVSNPAVSFQAGQWLDVSMPGVDVVGGFSLCSAPHELREGGVVRLAVKSSDHPPALWMHTKVHMTVYCLPLPHPLPHPLACPTTRLQCAQAVVNSRTTYRSSLSPLCIVCSVPLAQLLTSGLVGTLYMIPAAMHSMCCLWREELASTPCTQ